MINKNAMITFPDRIKKIIELSGSAEKLANISGMSSRVIGQYLAGKSDPTRKKLIALADAVQVNIEWLATGKGPMNVITSFKNRRLLGALDENVFALTHKVIMDYQDEIGRLLKPDIIGKLLYNISFFIISPQEDKKKTEGEIRRVLELILDISGRYLVFKKMNLGPDANVALLSFLEDLDSLYNEIQNEAAIDGTIRMVDFKDLEAEKDTKKRNP